MNAPTSTPAIDLAPFCEKNNLRSYIALPFRARGGAVATNGEIMVFVPGLDAPACSVKQVTEVVEKHLDGVRAVAAQDDGWISITDINIHECVRCTNCAGEGMVSGDTCADCNGEGYFLHGSHEYKCQECNGVGCVNEQPATQPIPPDARECSDCGGRGYPVRAADVQFSSPLHGIQVAYIELMRAHLPNPQINTTLLDGNIIAVRFDGGLGAVMAMYVTLHGRAA